MNLVESLTLVGCVAAGVVVGKAASSLLNNTVLQGTVFAPAPFVINPTVNVNQQAAPQAPQTAPQVAQAAPQPQVQAQVA